MKRKLKVIGGGLAGCEAAFQAAVRGVKVELYEMKPICQSPAHKSPHMGELVCSNSLRGAALSTAPGLLKEELRRLGSLVICSADQTQVPAGGALAVDREAFAALVDRTVREHPNIEVISAVAESLPEGEVIVATGPLSHGRINEEIHALLGAPLHFYDAAAPIIAQDSIDMEQAFYASRYGKGEDDYLNCPLNREQYEAFVHELSAAEEAPVKGFEDSAVFEGCMPVEVMARRGADTLRYGPMKPVGLLDPKTGQRPYAVVQLRAEDQYKSMYNLVGFQTHLKQPEQRRVFGMIPALKNAEFLRYGMMHRNSYLNAPGVLNASYRVIKQPSMMFAGQITGVEGYIESAASGFMAGVNMARGLLGLSDLILPTCTAIGALQNYVSFGTGRRYEPMNINFGIIDSIESRKKKRERYLEVAERALNTVDSLKGEVMEGMDEVNF